METRVKLSKDRLKELDQWQREEFGFKIMGWPLLCGLNSSDIGWIRFFGSRGFGFHWKDMSVKQEMFSDRVFKTWYLQAGKWRIKFLKPWSLR